MMVMFVKVVTASAWFIRFVSHLLVRVLAMGYCMCGGLGCGLLLQVKSRVLK